MKLGKVSLLATIAIVVVLVAVARGSGAQEANQAPPGWDTIRVATDGVGVSYQVWWDWSPLIVPTPDGGAWAFFSAVAAPPSSATPAPAGTQRLYASRFDPQRHVWLPATTMPGGEIQFAPAAAVASDGTVHLAYTDRATGAADSFGVVVYTRTDGNGGWTAPTPIAADPNAGHQLAPSMAIDQTGQLHAVWQDQRSADPASRTGETARASDADVFVSSLSGDAWSTPVQLDTRPNPTTYYSRPQIVADGDRLVAVWSAYDQAEIRSAQRLEWSSRQLGGEATWAPAQSLFDRSTPDLFFGGRLVDLAADPTGGVVLVYGTRTVSAATPEVVASADLRLRRLPAGSTTWGSDVVLGSGDRGAYPSVAVGGDGTVYVAYSVGSGDAVNVGALAIAPGTETPGPEVNLTPGEEGGQGIPVIAVDANSGVWVLYLSERVAGDANQIRVLRDAEIPTA